MPTAFICLDMEMTSVGSDFQRAEFSGGHLE